MLAGVGAATGLALGLVLRKRALAALRKPRSDDTSVGSDQAIEPTPVAPVADTTAPRVRSRDAHPDAPPRRPLVVTEDVLPYPTSVGEPAPKAAPFEQSPSLEPAPVASLDEDRAEEHSPFLAAALSSASRGDAPIVVSPAEPVIVPALTESAALAPVEHETVEPEVPVAAAPAVVASPPPLASLAAAAPQVPLNKAALASLGLVQLIERLALAIATRQERRAVEPDTPAPVEAVDPRMPLHRFDPLTMDPAGPLLRAKPSKADAAGSPDNETEAEFPDPASQIAQLHDPLASVEDWNDEDFDEGLPQRHLGLSAPDEHPVEDHDAPIHVDHVDKDVADHLYSSLAEMTMRRPELVPSDLAVNEPEASDTLVEGVEVAPATDPVVRFPSRLGSEGTTPRPETVSDEADRALREALATLRRMSAQR
jgi:hypothetical protein